MPKVIIAISPKEYDRKFYPDVRERIASLAQVVRNEERGMTSEEIKAEIANADCLIVEHQETSDECLTKAARLKLIASTGGYVPHLNINTAEASRIFVTNGGIGYANAVAEFGLGLILSTLRRISEFHSEMREAKEVWGSNVGQEELAGKTLGIIGVGAVARAFIRLLQPFNLTLLAYDPYFAEAAGRELGVSLVSLDELLKRARIIVVLAAATPATHHLLAEKELGLIPDGAILVNLSRGQLIDTQALIAELKKGRFKAAFDVFEKEPLPKESELRKLPNAFLTPHRAGGLAVSYYRIGKAIADDIQLVLAGQEPVNSHRISRKYAKMREGK